MESTWDALADSKKVNKEIKEQPIGMAVAALIFGALSLAMGIFLMGAIWGIVGIILGADGHNWCSFFNQRQCAVFKFSGW